MYIHNSIHAYTITYVCVYVYAQKSQLGSEIEEQKWVNDEQKREIDQKKRETEQQKTVTDQPKKEIDPLQKHIPGHQSTKQPLQKQVMKASAKKVGC